MQKSDDKAIFKEANGVVLQERIQFIEEKTIGYVSYVYLHISVSYLSRYIAPSRTFVIQLKQELQI